MVNIACSSLIQTILSVLEFHQISRRSGSRTITAGRESQPMLITTTPKNFLLSVFDYTICKSSFQYSFLFLMNFRPGTPKDIFTWMAAISNDGAFSSILVILLARIPSVVASTWCGHELMQENYVVSAVVFGVLLVLGVVCSYAYKKLSARHEARAKAQENTGKEEK